MNWDPPNLNLMLILVEINLNFYNKFYYDDFLLITDS